MVAILQPFFSTIVYNVKHILINKTTIIMEATKTKLRKEKLLKAVGNFSAGFPYFWKSREQSNLMPNVLRAGKSTRIWTQYKVYRILSINDYSVTIRDDNKKVRYISKSSFNSAKFITISKDQSIKK